MTQHDGSTAGTGQHDRRPGSIRAAAVHGVQSATV